MTSNVFLCHSKVTNCSVSQKSSIGPTRSDFVGSSVFTMHRKTRHNNNAAKSLVNTMYNTTNKSQFRVIIQLHSVKNSGTSDAGNQPHMLKQKNQYNYLWKWSPGAIRVCCETLKVSKRPNSVIFSRILDRVTSLWTIWQSEWPTRT